MKPVTSTLGLTALTALLVAAACTGTIDGEGGDTPGGSVQTTPWGPGGSKLHPIHRLNRLEYNNTVRDLLGVASKPADAFPPDGEADGFDNLATALQLTPTLLDAYFTATRAVVDEALDERPAYSRRFERDDLAVPGGYPVGELWGLMGQAPEVTVDVPAGQARVTLIAGASQVGSAPAPQLRLELDGAEVETFTVQGSAAALHGHVHEIPLSAGQHTLRYVPTNFVNQAAENVSNNVLVRELRVEAVENVAGPGRKAVFICEPGDSSKDACSASILSRFAERAWRRPLLDGEKQELTALYTQLKAKGEPTEAAIRLVLRGVLTSPKFLYRSRATSDQDHDGWLDDYTLASRLSYFLWSSMPDERLFAEAKAGKLSTEAGLTKAVTWMLADEKAAALRDGFAEQWLLTRRLQTASPSPEVYPEFDEALRSAMVEESKAFFGEFVSHDVPASRMLAPSFAFLNDRLAQHYGLDAVGSDTVERVAVSTGDRRGLLALSSWLVAQSDSERSSPIKRGRWISDTILCEPVPPPPAGLEVEPLEIGAEGLSVREALEKHREDPVCATCHSHLDVLGIGFERYDGVGRYRDEDDLDSLGELPSGGTFDGADELAKLVSKERFLRCVTRKLYTYAMGRSVGSYDERTIEQIGQTATQSDQTLAEMILAIVLSPAFRSADPMKELTK